MVDFTSAPGYVIDSQGRRQYQDRDKPNGISGTSLVAADRNAVLNSLLYLIQAVQIVPNSADDTQVWAAIEAMIKAALVGVGGSLSFPPVQQGGGLDQASSKIYLGRDTTFPGLRYSYGGTTGAVSCGYLISSYGPETGGPGASFAQIGDISLGTDCRLYYRGVSPVDTYYTGALLTDVQGVQANVTSEATARANADASLQANFGNYLPLSCNGKTITYGDGANYSVAYQTDGNLVVYYTPTGGSRQALFSVGGSSNEIICNGPVSVAYATTDYNPAAYGQLTAETSARASAITSESATRANADAALQASKQDNLGFTPVQQATGPNQTSGTVAVGQDSAFSGTLRAAINGTDTGPLVSGQYGAVLTSGDSPIWGIHWAAAGRPMVGWGSSTITWNSLGTYVDVQGVQANVTSEATARANADASLQANFGNYLPLSCDNKVLTYGDGLNYNLRFQGDGNLVVYNGSTPLFSVGGESNAINFGLPVSGNVSSGVIAASGNVISGSWLTINGVREIAFAYNMVTSGGYEDIDFPIAFSGTPYSVMVSNADGGDMDTAAAYTNWSNTGCRINVPAGSEKESGVIVITARGPA